MSSHIQIEGDAYTWTLDEPLNAGQLLAEWPAALKVTAPCQGTMVLSSRVAALTLPPSTVANSPIHPLAGVIPHDDDIPTSWLYLPSAIVQPGGPSVYRLPQSVAADDVVSEISAAMSSGNWITVPYGLESDGQLAINGAALAFAVVVPPQSQQPS
jgi:hypothetical protein